MWFSFLLNTLFLFWFQCSLGDADDNDDNGTGGGNGTDDSDSGDQVTILFSHWSTCLL